jgi:hypothetical protein
MEHTVTPRPRPRRRPRPRSILLAVAAAALVATGCGGDTTTDDVLSGAAEPDLELSIAIASYDLAVGEDRRLIAGLFTAERQLVGFGDVTVQLAYLGDQPGGEGQLSQQVTAPYLPVPGMEPEGDSDTPTLLDDPTRNGVYAATVDLDQPGFWGVRVVAALDDGRIAEGNTVTNVLPAQLNPAVGEPAPRTVNPTIDDVAAGTIRPVALDSRAQADDDPVPDEHLHSVVIADAIEAGRPVVVMISTPVYCVSRFCGPLVEEVAALALDYADRADVVHLEVWEDFEAQRVNPAAAEWIETEAGSFEPWVFLVGADGNIAARWDNVIDIAELEALLAELPPLPEASAAGAPGR